MSLDVYLTTPREGENCQHCDGTGKTGTSSEHFSRSVTHNLTAMAREAGIYAPLWRPDEIGITKAAQLVEPLTAGLALLRSDPERFRRFNNAHGWGVYEGLVRFVSEYLAACREHPDADVRASR